MSIEIKTTNLEEIKAMAEDLLNKAENAENVGEKVTIEKDLDDVLAEYAKISKAACYKAAKESGDPMKFAILKFYFPIIRVKETKDKDTGAILRSIIEADKPIDLGDLHNKLGGIGVNPHWIYVAEQFNFHLSKRAADRMNVKINTDAFYMNELAKQIDLGKNPCSNTQLLKTLNSVVQAMIGEEYHALSHDVNYLVDCYVNDNKKSKTSVTAANHKTLRNYLKKVCYRILTDGQGYDVEQKEVKEKK